MSKSKKKRGKKRGNPSLAWALWEHAARAVGASVEAFIPKRTRARAMRIADEIQCHDRKGGAS